ncbi:MAG TPA: hypothetical protein DEH22_04140 [Chloroflexi bacterium]|nr:hypothetical protein [Chloroflexota bacterium]
MEEKNQDSGWSIGAGIGLSALVGVLITTIVGLLRLSKPKEIAESKAVPVANKSFVATTANPTASGKPPAVASTPAADSIQPKSNRWSTGTKFFVSGLLLLALIGIVYISSNSISIVIFASLLTFVVHPVIKFFQRRLKMKRGLATLLTYILVLALILLIPILIIPNIVSAIQFVVSFDYLTLLENASNWLVHQSQTLATIPFVGATLSSSLAELARIMGNMAADSPQTAQTIDISFQDIGGRISQTISVLVSVFGPLISIGTTVVFTLLISLHMSLSVDMLRSGFKKLLPPAYEDEITSLFRRVILIWQSFLRGQISLMVIMGTIVWIGNAILGTPQALFLGIAAGLLEVIPSLGPILATIPAVILALIFGSNASFLGLDRVENWAFALIVIAFYILIQVIENQLLVPYILGDAVDLPPLMVIIGVVIGGSAFGLLGVFLATPVISSGREIFMYLYDKILEPPPELAAPEEKPSLMEMLRGYAARLPRPNFQRKKQLEEVVVAEQGIPEGKSG